MNNHNNDENPQEVLVEWVHQTSKTLPSASRALFHFLCAIKEDDRNNYIANPKWKDVWPLFRLEGDLPIFEAALSPLLDRKLIAEIPQENNQFEYILDPIVANIGLNEINHEVLRSIYADMTTTWLFQCMYIFDLSEEQLGDKTILFQVAMKAIYYSRKVNGWDFILSILNDLINYDLPSEAIDEVFPIVREVVTHTKGTKNELSSLDLLTAVLNKLGQYDEAEEIGRSLITKYISNSEYGLAFYQSKSITGILLNKASYKDALKMCRTALQCGYLAEKNDKWPEARIIETIPRYRAIAHCHYLMAACLDNLNLEPTPHLLAASIIYLQTDSKNFDWIIETTAKVVRWSESPLSPGPVNLPQYFEELCQVLNEINDVDFNSLFIKLPIRAENGNAALNLILEKISIARKNLN